MIKRGQLFALSAAIAFAFVLGTGFFPGHLVLGGENYGNHYVGGQEDFQLRLEGPADLIVTNYIGFSYANKMRNNSGSQVSIPRLGTPDFKIDAVSNATRFIKLTPFEILGGKVGFYAIIPFVHTHGSMSAGPMVMNSQSKTGLADIEGGVGLTWFPTKTFYHQAILGILAPTGSYDKADMVNIGRNYWSFDPFYVFSYLGDKDSPLPGLEISAKVMYWINTINTATSYTSGQEFSTDYVVGQHFGNWRAGVNGHFLYQLTDDRQYGTAARDPFTGEKTGVRGKYLSIGPVLSYKFSKGAGAFVSAKYQHDVMAQNRPEGGKFWLNLTWPF